jgi:lysylphosphatidylglycerol synthetase-like protein (DUF2156 family)
MVATMADRGETPGVRIEHPNREKASSKATKAVTVLLLLISAALMAVVTIGGWERLEGAKAMQISYIVLYVVLAFFIARWKRGLLPVAAALAIVLLIFAAISGPAWFDRDKAGFDAPALDEGILGVLTLLLVPLQLLLFAFAMRGFQQAWHVEVEHPVDDVSRPSARPRPGGAAAPA